MVVPAERPVIRTFGPSGMAGRPGPGFLALAEFPVEVTIAKVTVRGEVIATATVRDITERKRAEQALSQRALQDALTGLVNRTLLMDRLSQVLLRRAPDGGHVALLFIDLDRVGA